MSFFNVRRVYRFSDPNDTIISLLALIGYPNYLLMKLYYMLSLFLLCTFSVKGQEKTPEPHFCGTAPSTLNQEKQGNWIRKQSKNFGSIKTTGSVLYVPFKYKGESDPSITDMEAVKAFFLRNSYGIYTLNTTITPIIEMPFTRQEDKDDKIKN